MEMLTTNEPKTETTNHFSHEHPLKLVIDQTLINQDSFCAGCNLPPQSGSIYSCTICPFFLHKKCFEMPNQINHLCHKAHLLTLLPKPLSREPCSDGMLECAACGEYGNGFSYHCESCTSCPSYRNIIFHILCVRAAPSSEDDPLTQQMKMLTTNEPKTETTNHFSHEHPLKLVINQTLINQDSFCAGCKLPPQSGSIYSCTICPFFLHKKCFEMPNQINHPCHEAHPLTLLPKPLSRWPCSDGMFKCAACDEYGNGFSYHCESCVSSPSCPNIFFHILCVSAASSVTHASHHHRLNLVFKSPYNICGICEGDIDYWAYKCNLCDFNAHMRCATGKMGNLLERFYKRTGLNWTEYHYKVVRDYVSLQRYKWDPDYFYTEEKYIKSVTDAQFKIYLRKFFLKRILLEGYNDPNETMAAFINFLVQLLSEIDSFEGLRKELVFFLKVFGDGATILDQKGISNMFCLFEYQIAYRAGTIMHSLIFSTDLEFRTLKQQRYDVLLEHMPIFRKNIINVSLYQLSIVQEYVSKFNRELSYEGLMEIKLNDEYRAYLKAFFLGPKQFENLGKNELLAAFINFLLQLLYEKKFLNEVYKNLRFLLMVLGDATIFLYHDEHEPVHIDLLAEVEAMANLVGSSVHSFLFSTYEDPVNVETHFGVFFERMALLKGNILKFFDLLPVLNAKSSLISNSNKNSSLFIVDSLIIDLENLLKRDDSVLNGDMKTKIEDLQNLMRSWLFLKSISVPPSHDSEIQHVITRIIEVSFEAEYLIISFLAGDAPLWYFSRKIELITEKDFSTSQQQAKRNFEVDEDIVVGFEERAKDILEKLVQGTGQLQNIFIFGMPGLGKTTFAKKLYNHPIVKEKFDRRSWCVVSQMYQRKSLLTDILINTSTKPDKDKILKMKEEELKLKIHQSLFRRRYLIVIDDIWDMNAWDDLFGLFPDDGNGSRVLITSRNKDVAPTNSIKYELPFLSKVQCWELLQKKVFKDEPCPTQLLEVGNEIATNCGGLPLTVVVIAGILSATEATTNAWKKVGEKILSYSSCREKDPIMQIMELSYNYLPQYLKPCFLYFGLFAEDKEISAHELMCFWVAEGFIPQDKKSSDLLAHEYLMQLINKNLVILAKKKWDGRVKACVIHDRLRDLCLKKSEEENFCKRVVKNEYSIYDNSHRLVRQSREKQLLSYFGPCVRSFHCNTESNLRLFVANIKLVRVLDVKMNKGLMGVEYLVNLRCLVIGGEYLCVYGKYCYKIPFRILKMDKLRYIKNFEYWASFDEDWNPSQTNNLQVLSRVYIRNLKDEEMLKCSPHLRKLKCHCVPFAVEEKGGVKYRYLDLLFFIHLESLTIMSREGWSPPIEFPSNIKKLHLCDLKLPLGNMSIIGKLPNLQVLKLQYKVFVGYTWETRDGEFQQLIFLKLEHTYFKRWYHFPVLQRLVLTWCLSLEEVPCEIGEIPTLQLIEVSFCIKSLGNSVRKIEKEQREYGNKKLEIIIESERKEETDVEEETDDVEEEVSTDIEEEETQN